MKLETEFRLCLEQQKMEQRLHELLAVPASPPTASTWVKLVQPIEAVCSDEALLLCQCGTDQWLAWIPDLGEVVLDREQFVFDA